MSWPLYGARPSVNNDAIAHSVFSPEGRYDLGSWSQGHSKEHTFTKVGVYTQLCHQHPEMEAFVIVLDTPYFATTKQDGAFQMSDVPAGRYTLVAWSEIFRGPDSPSRLSPDNPRWCTSH
jgi:hypothetical protein